MGRSPQTLLIGVSALVFGSMVAWVDMRPKWDDTGVTAGALLLSAALASALGLRWWASALLVALPIVLLEHQSAGWGIVLILAFTIAGAALGAAFRLVTVRRRAN
jgi:hypothetical protein